MPNLFNNQYANLASKGRFGDTMLAHINPQEAALLKARGGAGTINPQTGLREFYQDVYGNTVGMPTTLPTKTEYMGGLNIQQTVIEPFDRKFADTSGSGGMGVLQIKGYTVPTDDKKFADIPLEAKYDPKGNFLHYTLKAGEYLTPDPSQPNIQSVPRIGANGEILDWGIVDVNEQDNGSFGSFVRDIATEFAPMILAGLAANFAAGNLLTGFGTSASVGTLSPYAAQAAGAYGAGGAAAAGLPAAVATGGGLLGSGSPMAGIPTSSVVTPTAAAATATGSSVTPSMLQSIANATGISVDTLKTFGPSVIQGLIGAGGSYLTSEQATDAARAQAEAQIRAAQIAADAARFRPVGVTTRFGSSNFQTDAAGNVISAGYTPSAEIKGYQDRLSALANLGLTDAEAARAAYQPLTGAAQSLFTLGQGYLAKTPEEAAQDYIKKQQALLAPSQQSQLAQLQNQLFQQGRGGVAVSQGGDLMNTNPEMAAYYNSLAQSNLVLAAQADQEARNQILFGAGLFGTGADLQGQYYSGQTAAYAPFTTAMDVTSGLESLAQVPLTLGTQIGAQTTAGAANAGLLTSQGIMNAANTMAPANAYSLGGNILSGAANSPMLAGAINQGFGNTQQPKQQTYTFNPTTGQYIPVQQSVWST